jgi:hypothetical protein
MIRSFPWALIAAPLALNGCVSFETHELAAMSTLDLCETHVVQRVNLSTVARQRVESELERRKVDCRSQLAAIKARQDEDLYDRMYRNQSP